MLKPLTRGLLLALCCLPTAWADGPQDNVPSAVRPVPPVGISIDPQVIRELSQRAADLERRLQAIPNVDEVSRAQVAVIPRAIQITIDTHMFYNEREPALAKHLLDEGERRLAALQDGSRGRDLLGIAADGNGQPQTVIGGFISKIDQSIQPFGLVIPSDWSTASASPMRLDVWLHGRGEKVSEVAFLHQRLTSAGEFQPAGTIVLHPYGRYCNAFKFAGEIDVLEAIEQVEQLLPIDTARTTIRGFSMGGAGCWQLAVHYPNLWAAANPGAGFSETTEFLRDFQQEEFVPTAAQRRLLHWYDCPDWTNNLRNVPTVAYSGEIDRQKQAADVMAAAFDERGMQLTHIIGPQTAHKIHPESKPLIEDFLSQAVRDGKPQVPPQVDLTTYSLRYHRLGWLSIEGLQEHWSEARVQGQLRQAAIDLHTQNTSQLRLEFSPGKPFATGTNLTVRIDEQPLQVRVPDADPWQLWLHRDTAGTWQLGPPAAEGLRKRPGLQGPIDDAFMDSFVFVPPANTTDSIVDRWVDTEFQHATSEWRRHFRGDIRQVDSQALTEQHLRDHHVILFGTPQSNPWIAKVMESLPIAWTSTRLQVGATSYDAQNCVPLLIYPNPLNPQRYVVLNSGFTFREYAYLNNARQIPMLPDWAVIDVRDGATSQVPGAVQQAGFFDENWQLKSQ